MILQKLNYTENPTDIPNPDRGFYRPNSYVMPVEAGDAPTIPDLNASIIGSTVSVQSRIVYMEFDMRNFSSNAPLDGLPPGPWSDTVPTYGTTQPLTQAALDYVRTALEQIRQSEAVCIVKFNYDGRGYTYNNRDGYDLFLHDCEPGAPQGRAWYDSGKITEEKCDKCGQPGHEDKNWVQYHLWQLGNVFTEYEDVIMCVKGGFFGPWGEMHSSSYARTAQGYHWLLNALLDYVPKSRSILVHAGGVMAWHNVEYGTAYNFTNLMPAPEMGTPAQRFGMFNDSYSAGSEDFSDGGSLSEGIALVGGEYCRNGALTWMRNQNNFYGGESVGSGDADNIYPRFPNVVYEATYARTMHLNTSYSPRTYFLWEDFEYTQENITQPFTPPHDGITRIAKYDPAYEGRNGMTFMRDRLGFRFVLREAYVKLADGLLSFSGLVENMGFGNIINGKKVSVILQPKSHAQTDWSAPKHYSTSIDLDPKQWQAGEVQPIEFVINMADFGILPPGEYNIYLKINDPKETSPNKRSIQFANFDIWHSDFGASRIGVVEVA